jgi:hypothetical protein
MAGTAYQGALYTAQVLSEDDALNTDTGAKAIETMYFGWNWNQPYPGGIELEKYSRRMTNAFKITFTEQKRETNAETSYVHIVYKITK